MATLQDKLAQSFAVLKKLQDEGIVAIHTQNMTRTHRECLVKNGFIKKVMKGWYIPARPEEPAGESTAGMPRFERLSSDLKIRAKHVQSRFNKKPDPF